MKFIPRSPGNKKFCQAFTLLEQLVAISILALMVALLGNVFSSTFSVLTRAQGNVDNSSRARPVLDCFQSDLAQAVNRPDLGIFCDGSGNTVDSSGNACIAFYAERAGIGPDDRYLCLISYKIQPNSNGKLSLMRQMLPIGWSDESLVTFGNSTQLPQLSNTSVTGVEIAPGILSFVVKFFDLHGNVKNTFDRTRCRAISLSMLVIDDRTDQLLSVALETALRTKFEATAAEAEAKQTSVAALWRDIIADTKFWASYPQGMAGRVKVLERTYFLPPSLSYTFGALSVRIPEDMQVGLAMETPGETPWL